MVDKFNPKFAEELLRCLPIRVFWKNADGVYLGCNDSFVQSLGLSSEQDVIGKTDFTLPMEIKEAAAYRKDDLNVMKSKQARLNIEEEQTFPNGKKIYLLTSKVPLSVENNGIDGILGIYSDITELKLTQQQLKLEKKRAQIASKSKSEFIANMSHDLRTPITGILGMMQDMINMANYAEPSLNHPEAPQHRQLLENIIRTVQHNGQLLIGATDELLRLCNEVLEIASLESGKFNDNIESFNLRELVKHNIELLQPVAQHKKLNLSYHIDPQVPEYLHGHRIYLGRILLNLISNSLKFTEQGAVTVSITNADKNNSNRSLGTTNRIRLVVEDTGIGIPEDKFDFIFEHFSRLKSTYEDPHKGIGLGLYTVKRYVAAMQGSIKVSSKLTQGTSFAATLAFRISDHARQPTPPKKTIKKPTIAHNTPLNLQGSLSTQKTKASVLVVEDQALAAYAVVLTLKSFGCHVETAENGAQAVEMAQRGCYDLILMDIGLPDLSGVEVTKKIRAFADPVKSQTPIIALSGHANHSGVRQEAIHAGVQDLIDKPARAPDLASVLQHYVFEKKMDLLTCIDWNICVNMYTGDPKLAYEMLNKLSKDLESSQSALKKAYTESDAKALSIILHRIHGAIGYLETPQLKHALAMLHWTINTNPANKSALETHYLALQKAIDTFQSTLASGQY